MPEGNPLVAESEGQEHPNPVTHPFSNFTISPTDLDHGGLTKATEGAGIFNDVASTIQDAKTGNWGGLAMDIGADAIDALGIAMDPLGSLAGAGIGWLIEHVSFLKKPLDWLAGDPEAVTAKAQTLQNVSQHLQSSAANYVNSVGKLQQTQGSAADGYRRAAQNYQQAVTGLAGHLDEATQAMHTAAMIVGTTRGIVRDSISQFVGDAIVKFIAASALAPVTFGGSEAAFIADEVVEGTSLATRNAGRVSKVVKETETLAKGAKKSETALRDGGEGFARATNKVEDFNTRAAAHGESVHEHGVSSEGQLGREAGHNERAITNEQDLAANRDALGHNQRDIDRALADKNRGDIRAGNRERGPLKDENRRRGAEDRALNRERHELEQDHNRLRHEGNRLNEESSELAAERRGLINERLDEFHDHGVGPGRDLHHYLEEHRAAELGHKGLEYGTEAGRNVFTSQGTRDTQIAYEYEHKLHEEGEIRDGSFVEEEQEQPAHE
ncbi:MAG TPA: hypothetical protein VGR06_28510 [Actinophytocola sp.]|jgi:uncharacterized protein YukE|uniref:hypothetical protein n=1 Tax=Actinophytocola sp. TaxID=1872138 RepID=UPI002DFCCD9B|nr:hypothetical protein [Actinophytocola sp.]